MYVTRDNIFTMSFTDAKNEPHPIQIPVGGAGIPIHEFFYLGCEVGLTDRETLLRIIVDGRELRTLTLPFRADIGSLDVPNGVFGADLNGGNCAQVDLAEIVVYSGTLDPTGVKAFSDHFQKENYLRLERGNAYAEFNGTQWSRIKDAPPGQRDGIQPDPEKRPTYRLLKE